MGKNKYFAANGRMLSADFLNLIRDLGDAIHRQIWKQHSDATVICETRHING